MEVTGTVVGEQTVVFLVWIIGVEEIFDVFLMHLDLDFVLIAQPIDETVYLTRFQGFGFSGLAREIGIIVALYHARCKGARVDFFTKEGDVVGYASGVLSVSSGVFVFDQHENSQVGNFDHFAVVG